MTDLPLYTRAFRAYTAHIGGLDIVRDATGIGDRKLERMYAGKARTPPGLLRELAIGADETGATALGTQLRDAAAQLDAANPNREATDA